MRLLASLLSLNRIGFGLAYLLAPGRAGRGWVGRAARDPATQVFVRGHGARDGGRLDPRGETAAALALGVRAGQPGKKAGTRT
jgi:hypothetical protein